MRKKIYEPARELTIQTIRSNALYLRSNWVEGSDNTDSGVSFSLDQQAGLGGQCLVLTVHKGEQQVTEVIDVTTFLPGWVNAVLADDIWETK